MIAVVVLVLSLAGPLGADGATSAKAALAIMHLVCGAIVIPVFARSR